MSVEIILKKSKLLKNNNVPYLILIAGPSGSGKTTIADEVCRIVNEFGNHKCLKLKMDDYYYDLSHLSEEQKLKVNFDTPKAIEMDLLHRDLHTLLVKKEPIEHPVYDFNTTSRLKDKTVRITPNNIIVLDGLFTLTDKRIRDLANLKLYVDTDLDVCLARRVQRDLKRRGYSIDETLDNYLHFVKKGFNKFIRPYKRNAHLVIFNNKSMPTEAVKLIFSGLVDV